MPCEPHHVLIPTYYIGNFKKLRMTYFETPLSPHGRRLRPTQMSQTHLNFTPGWTSPLLSLHAI